MVIALDLGRVAAAAVGNRGGRPALMSREFPADLGACAADFEGFIRGLITKHEPAVLAWERPFTAFRTDRYGKPLYDAQGEIRTQRLYGQAFNLEKHAHVGGIKTWFERPVRVRKQVVGRGNAKPEDIMRFAHSKGLKPANDHEADAFVIWSAACGAFGGL